MKKIRQILKNQKGLTLVELLAVVVILGIIAAIAVPSIGGIINNTKKDAHIANAEMMVSAARLAVTSGEIEDSDNEITLGELQDGGYLEPVESPGTAYALSASKVILDRDPDTGNIAYKVTLVYQGNAGNVFDTTDNPSEITRAVVNLK